MDKLINLPKSVKWFLGVTGLGALLATGVVMGSGKWVFLVILVLPFQPSVQPWPGSIQIFRFPTLER